jgi:hypothetical protein
MNTGPSVRGPLLDYQPQVNMYTVEILQVELQGKQKNIRVIEIHFSCLSFSWIYSRLMSFSKKNMVKDLPTFCLDSI